MTFFPEDILHAIRERVDLVALIGERVALRRAGTNFVGLCPFHAEKSPSFSVNPTKQFFYCFGCQKSGDAFRFLMELDGRGFVETVEELARRAGVDLPSADGEDASHMRRLAEKQSERSKVVKVLAWAADWFEEQVALHPEAVSYMQTRGISEETQRTFRIGYAPDQWDGLVQHLRQRKVPEMWMERAGLSIARSSGGWYDRFRRRLMFPLQNTSGEVIAFGGRLVPGASSAESGEGAKYINSPETVLYKKGEHLYGLFQAKEAIRRGKQVILVEGNVDVLSLHKCGFRHTVAPMGTALTSMQVRILHRLMGAEGQVVLMLDGDQAGRAAIRKDIALLLLDESKTEDLTGLDVRVATLSDGIDPDALAQKDPQALAEHIRRSVPAVDYMLDQALQRLQGAHIAERAQVVEQVAPLLRAVRNPTALRLYVDKLASSVDIPAAVVWNHIRGSNTGRTSASNRPEPRAEQSAQSNTASALTLDPLSRQLLALCADHPSLCSVLQEDKVALLPDAWVVALLGHAKQHVLTHAQPEATWLIDLAPSEGKESVASVAFAGIFTHVGRPEQVLTDLYTAIQTKWWQRTLQGLKQEWVALSKQGDDNLATQVTHQIREAMEELRKLQGAHEEHIS